MLEGRRSNPAPLLCSEGGLCAQPASARLRSAYDRCKMFPEVSKSSFMALLELRNMMSEAMAEIKALRGEPGTQL
jgi:hypothetical protein